MGYKHSYSLIPAYQEIRAATYECANPKTDSYIAWGIKQDLYQLKWFIDNAIQNCPEFSSMESDWLKLKEQEKILGYLKGDL